MTETKIRLLGIETNPAEGEMHLKPCPFCGESEVIYWAYERDVGERWKVFCIRCAAGIDPGWAQTKGAVASLWNKRVVE